MEKYNTLPPSKGMLRPYNTLHHCISLNSCMYFVPCKNCQALYKPSFIIIRFPQCLYLLGNLCLRVTLMCHFLSNILLVTLIIQKHVEELNNTEFCEATPRPVSPFLLIIKSRLQASPGHGSLATSVTMVHAALGVPVG